MPTEIEYNLIDDEWLVLTVFFVSLVVFVFNLARESRDRKRARLAAKVAPTIVLQAEEKELERVG